MRILQLLTVCLMLISLTASLRENYFPSHWRQGKHDSHCYTQGLSFINSTHLLQSCGLYGQSYFQIYSYDQRINALTLTYKSNLFHSKYFGEGSILFPGNNMIYVLTWQEHTVLRYRLGNQGKSFEELPSLKWWSDGWGMTHNHTHIFISDGSNHIYITDQNITVKQTLSISDERGAPLRLINQLQWRTQNGTQYIYANVYMQTVIVKVSIPSSRVVERYDLKGLKKVQLKAGPLRTDEVLNGIAITGNTIVVTGKKWRSFFATQFHHDGL